MSHLEPSPPSDYSSLPPVPTPAWGKPKAPLPPYKLAKLANALGVSTPLPFRSATTPVPGSSAPYSATSTPSVESFRSPTPSSISASSFSSSSLPPLQSSPSKYLLHVIPPLHLPHSRGSTKDRGLTPPPYSASGYHNKFRRGTMVPVHPTFNAQLAAIAREYALPSTTGMILYLVSTTVGRYSDQIDSPISSDTTLSGGDEPGPRISDEIWKHVWHRVLRAEQDEQFGMLSAAGGSQGLGLSSAVTAGGTLRALVSPSRMNPPRPGQPAFPRSPSTASFTSESHPQSHSFASSSIQSDPDTADTSFSDDLHHQQSPTSRSALSIDLPGLNSPSLIPILAKVEFDIDRKKALWYEPWLRSRRMNHAKRKGLQRSVSTPGTSAVPSAEIQPVPDRKAPLVLALVDGDKSKYAYHTESPEPMDSGSESDEDDTHRLTITPTTYNRPYFFDEHGNEITDEAKIKVLMEKVAQSRAVPKPAPAPLDLTLNPSEEYPTMRRRTKSTSEANGRPRTPVEEKRGGGVFDDLDLDLGEFDKNDPYDRRLSQYLMKANLDEIERNLAQFSPTRLQTVPSSEQIAGTTDLPTPKSTSATLAPPGHLFSNEPFPAAAAPIVTPAPPSPSPSPASPTSAPLPVERPPRGSSRNLDGSIRPTPTQPTVNRKPSPVQQSKTSMVPAPSPPPQPAVNGVSAAASPGYSAPRRSSSVGALVPNAKVRQEHEEEAELAYRKLSVSTTNLPSGMVEDDDSPVIPLSPDPFGRQPSTVQPPPQERRQPSPYWDAIPVGTPTGPPTRTQTFGDATRQLAHPERNLTERTTSHASEVSETSSSRFSADSLNTVGSSAPLAKRMSVRSIKNLWRKSVKESISVSSQRKQSISVSAAQSTRILVDEPHSASPPGMSGSNIPKERTPEMPKVPPAPLPSPPQLSARHKRDSSMDHFHYDVDQSASPPPGMPRSNPKHPALRDMKLPPPPSFDTPSSPAPFSPPPSPFGQSYPYTPPTPAEKNRKSILKGWKLGASNSSNVESGHSRSNSKSNRLSVSSSRTRKTSTSEVPASPRLPPQYMNNPGPGQGQPMPVRKGSKESDIRISAQRRPTLSRDPSVHGGSFATLPSPRPSNDTRPSFDSTQFEIVSPPTNHLRLPPTYNGQS